jgi:PAS domain S-box-containing protein
MIQGARQSVLLVDDEPQILVALEDLLSEQFTVYTASSAEAALEVMGHETDIAVVVTDQRMPKMTGDELVTRLCTVHDAQRILVTGFADLTAVVRAVNEGRIFAYVTKPWNEHDLRFKVTQAANHFRLSRELDAERQLLHDLMDNSPDGIYFKDSDLRFRRTNRAFASWVGQTSDELVGDSLSDLSTVFQDVPSLDALERKVLNEGRPILDVLTEIRSGASSRWVSEVRAPVRNGAGEIEGLVGISRDVTAQLLLEQQLLQSQKMDAIGRLAGGVAHDFNNLLAVIQSYAMLALDSLPAGDAAGGDSARSDLGELLKATDRAAGLTKQLLTFSRRQPRTMTTVELDKVAEDVSKMLSRLIDGRVRLVTRLGAPAAQVRVDLTQLEQVLLNLTINARDAMPDGGVVTIETSWDVAPHLDMAPDKKYVRLSVIDTGTGMTPEIKARIFEPFFSTKEVGKGTGLGLSTVYGIVQQAGGTIGVESEVGHGTRFDVFLPLAPVAVSGEPAPSSSELRHDQGGETILIVEDEEAVRRVTSRILDKLGYKVIQATGTADAQRIFAAQGAEIDLLLSDVVMPEMLGPTLYAELRQHKPDLRALFMSGHAESSAGVAQLPDGVVLLEKPFTPSRLALELRKVLRQVR